MRSLQTLSDDERAIEGLPIRLVIALVVGAASLSVMMGMISGINGLAVSEVDAQPRPDVLVGNENQSVTIRVVDADGNSVENATVVVQGDSANLAGGIRTAKTNADGTVTMQVTPKLGVNQDEGTLAIDIKPPAGSQYTDERTNTDILVIDENGG